MAENAGAIKYTVSADTAAMLKAEAVIDKSLTKISKEFDKADVAVKNFEKSQKTLGNTVNKMGQVLDKNGNIVEDLTLEYRKLATEASGSFNKLNTQISKTAKGVNSSLSGMGRNAGMAGIQVQQFVGQLQGGQNAMVALSQQGADLGFVLGAPLVGAIVGIGASVIGMAAAFGEVKVEMSDTSSIVKELTGDFSELDAEAQKITKSLIVFEIAKQEKALKALQEEQRTATGFWDVVLNSTEENAQEAANYTANVLKQELAIKKLKEQLKKLGTDQTDYVAILDKQQTSIGDLITSTVHLGNTYGFNARELAVYEAELLGANDAQIAALNLSFDTIESKEAEAEATKKQALAEKRLNDEKERSKTKASSFAGGITKRGLSQEDKLQADLDQLLRDESLISITEFELAKTSIEKQQVDLRKEIREKDAKESLKRDNMILASSGQFFGSMADVLKESEGEQSGIYKAMFALSKGFAIAQAGLNLTTAISQASILPYPSNIPAMLSAATSGASLVSSITGASYSGGREHGGPVSAGKMYQVGEGGKPEIFSSGGKNFMIPGDNGNVTSNADAFGGDGGQAVNVSVVVENNAPNTAVSTSSSDDGRMIKLVINEVANQITRNQGQIPRALRQSTNTTMKANK